jgi:hypothetical protein
VPSRSLPLTADTHLFACLTPCAPTRGPTMDEGKLVKMEQDMSGEVDALLPQADARAKVRL